MDRPWAFEAPHESPFSVAASSQRMSEWAPYFLPAFVVIFWVWVEISALLLFDRIRYDFRHRFLRAATAELELIRKQASSIASKERIEDLLSSLPRRVIEEVAADSMTPRWQAEVFASYVIDRWGAQRVIRAASSHRGEKEKWLRVEALRILTLGGSPEALPLLEKALCERDSELAGGAVAILGRMDNEAAVRLLVKALKENRYAFSRIATQLDRVTNPIDHVLRPLLRDPLPVVRFWAVTLLSRYAGGDEINSEVASLAADSNSNVRKAVVETLGKAGGPFATQTAVNLLSDPVWYVRAHAARALGDLQSVELSQAVTPLLADREWWVRSAAKDALEAMGPEAAPQIIPYLESKDRFARNGAAEVLENLGVFDTLISEMIENGSDTQKLELIRRMVNAGGEGMMKASIGRADPELGPAIRRIFEIAGILETSS